MTQPTFNYKPNTGSELIADALWGIAAAITEASFPDKESAPNSELIAMQDAINETQRKLDRIDAIYGTESFSGAKVAETQAELAAAGLAGDFSDEAWSNDWRDGDRFTETDLEPYLDELDALAQKFSAPQSTPEMVRPYFGEPEDLVNEPSHYKEGGFECIDFTWDLAFPWANVVKYVWRFRGKNGLEDLEKAKRYLEIARERHLPQPESEARYSHFLSLYFDHSGVDPVGEQRLYVLRQVFAPDHFTPHHETVEGELSELIRTFKREEARSGLNGPLADWEKELLEDSRPDPDAACGADECPICQPSGE